MVKLSSKLQFELELKESPAVLTYAQLESPYFQIIEVMKNKIGSVIILILLRVITGIRSGLSTNPGDPFPKNGTILLGFHGVRKAGGSTVTILYVEISISHSGG